MRHSFLALSLIGLLAAGCIDPDLANLAAVQKLAGQGETAAVADYPVDCDPSRASCARIHEMAGDACLKQAQEAVGTAAAASRVDCAQRRYNALLSARGDTASLGLRRLEAARLDRETATNLAQAAEANAALARQAAAYAKAYPGRAGGPYFTADAVIWRTVFARPADPCPDLAEAGRLLDAAATAGSRDDPIALDGPAATLKSRVAAMSARAGCAS